MVTIFIGSGCSSSETAQKETAAAPTDTANSQSQHRPKASGHQRLSSSGKQEGFLTQEDTIEAEVITRNHGSNHVKPPSKHSLKKKYYSVQLGAFRTLSNADRAKKVAQQRYKKPIYQFYDKPIKMYRVTLGNFSKLNDALTFLKTIQQQHPKEYKDAWVAEMRR